MSVEIREALKPVIHWYQSDEVPGRNTEDIMTDVVSDLLSYREAAFLLSRIVLKVREIEGPQARRMMSEIWPLLCEADTLPSMPPRDHALDGDDLTQQPAPG